MLRSAWLRRRRCSHLTPSLRLLAVLAGSWGCRSPAATSPPASPGTPAARAVAAPGTSTPELVLAPLAAPAATGGAPPAPTASPGTRVIVEVRIVPSARLIADVNLLGRKLPMRLGDLLVQTIAKAAAEEDVPLDASLLAALAPDRPIALLLAQHTPQRGDDLFCVALPFARADDAAGFAARLGVVLSDRGGATERRHSSGVRIWTGVKDRTLLVTRAYDDLWTTGARALAISRGPLPAEDAVATADLDAFVATSGSNWDDLSDKLGDALAAAIDDADIAGRGTRKAAHKPAHAHASAEATETREGMRLLGRRFGMALAQAARARLALSASASDGLVLSAALEPRPGTALAQRAATASVYALDPRLPITDDRTGVIAWGSLGMLEPLLRAQLPPADARGKVGAASHRSPLDGFLAAFTGGGSCLLEAGADPMSTVCSLPLRAGIDARAALEGFAALVRAIAAKPPQTHHFAAKIRKDLLEFDWPLDVTSLSPEQAATLRGYIGGEVYHYAAAVRGGRLLLIQGRTPRARLAAWSDTPAGAPVPARPPPIEETLARTRGDSLVMLFDPLAIVLKLLAHANDPRSRQARIMLSALPGLAATRTPVVFDAPAGPQIAYELRIPMVTFDNLAALIAPFMGIMGLVGE
jgi:hypothetical protein